MIKVIPIDVTNEAPLASVNMLGTAFSEAMDVLYKILYAKFPTFSDPNAILTITRELQCSMQHLASIAEHMSVICSTVESMHLSQTDTTLVTDPQKAVDLMKAKVMSMLEHDGELREPV